MQPAYALAGYPDAFVQQVMARHRDAFRMALGLGVKIVFGTDAGRFPHGQNAEEFHLMVQAGMEPMHAIQAATSVAAELLRAEDDIGAVRAGCVADLVGVEGDPLTDVNVLRDIRFVMKSGSIVKGLNPHGGQLRAGTDPRIDSTLIGMGSAAGEREGDRVDRTEDELRLSDDERYSLVDSESASIVS